MAKIQLFDNFRSNFEQFLFLINVPCFYRILVKIFGGFCFYCNNSGGISKYKFVYLEYFLYLCSLKLDDMKKAYFFDMDGVLFDSMPNHAIAWDEVMKKHNLPFTAYDCYLNEGRTGESVIREAMWKAQNRDATPDEIATIYAEKSDYFTQLEQKAGGTATIPGVAQVLEYIHSCGNEIWVVTGSGMRSLLDNLNHVLPPVFAKERMITAYDVQKGKPDPEPYLKAWERCGLNKEQCVVIENAPLGVRSGKAAGLTVYAVNTGILTREDLLQAGADKVFDSMAEVLEELRSISMNYE